MIIYDAIYGSFELPSFMDKLVMAPEFRRLSEVRLVNINSPTLAALADVRRYSHTLGALRLALLNPLLGLGEDEHRALLASIVVHDAGTPAFAHLFEYFLSDHYKWNHEEIVTHLLRRAHHPDANSHQIYASQIPQFERICRNNGIDFDLVVSIINGTHPASQLIFGTLDFDNIDNVLRMNYMMGFKVELPSMLALASALGVNQGAKLLLPMAQRTNVRQWADLRRQAYNVLVFDGPTVAGQAVLSRAISDALISGALSADDWSYTDTDLIKSIRDGSDQGKRRLDRDFFGSAPDLLLLHQITNIDHPLMMEDREQVMLLIEEFLLRRLNARRCYGYSFRDRGTFEKRIEATDPESGNEWSIGTRSNSLIVYGFGKITRRAPNPRALGEEFAQWAGGQVAQ